ncbi:MAG TPA: acyl-CoA dehydrogenase family protein [Acidimicrobiales bacterium]|nr:acyl-CoA dehydrogenase family protein [Acidimicrobiales bacterium]
MDLSFSAEDEVFRAEARAWLTHQLDGPHAVVRDRGGPGDEHALFDKRLAWEHTLAEAGWTCVGWPTEFGGRGLSLHRQVIWFEEYARAGGPGRLGHIGETLLGPTLIHFGNADQQARFLPGIVAGDDLWAQGYSEPDAGSDLANVATRAERDGDDWVITGQKVWTSLAHWARWAFVLCRTDRDAPKHKGLSYLLVPLDQDGVEIRPIRQISGASEFNEVFFEGARTSVANTVGAPGDGWKVANGTLAFERGASTLGQQLRFTNEFDALVATARANGAIDDPVLRQRLTDAWLRLRIMRLLMLRVLSATESSLAPAAMVTKLYWASWHRDLGELAMGVLGAAALDWSAHDIDDPERLTPFHQLFLFSRSDTIYAGSNEIQRNIIAERALGLPREPRPPVPSAPPVHT